MNDKLAKHLRRMAERIGATYPPRQHLVNKNNGMIINAPQSVRGLYRLLKKQARYYRKNNKNGNNLIATS